MDIEKRKAGYREHIIKTACELKAKGKRVHIVGSSPEFAKDVPVAFAKALLLGMNVDDISIDRSAYEQRNAFVFETFKMAQKQCGADYIDISNIVCEKEKCYGVKDNHSMYADDDHMNVFGNERLKKVYKKALVIK
jgi:hypothetical protein